jgi:endoglucanase
MHQRNTACEAGQTLDSSVNGNFCFHNVSECLQIKTFDFRHNGLERKHKISMFLILYFLIYIDFENRYLDFEPFWGSTMIKKLLSAMAIGCMFSACDNGTAPPPVAPSNSKNQSTVVPVDYTQGRFMNSLLGRGINLGNSWDSEGYDDSGWGNPIRDTDFAIIKAAGFNSVRIPVRWQTGSDRTNHTVDPNRMAGVKEDIRLAIANGLTVVVNFHHYFELNCAGGGHSNYGCSYKAAEYAAEKAHFLQLWKQVAIEMQEFSDYQVVLEILNEPVIPDASIVDKLMKDAYDTIRTYAPGKTIMFETYHAAKFEDLESLHLPQDGNIIFSGHYYQPYTYSHQGNHGNKCLGDAAYANSAETDMAAYAALARRLYPDINGIDHVPMNMGEFGVAGGSDMGTCTWKDQNGNQVQGVWPSDQKKANWAQKTAQAAISNGISFHYWGFGQTGGFNAYNTGTEQWNPGFPQALLQ